MDPWVQRGIASILMVTTHHQALTTVMMPFTVIIVIMEIKFVLGMEPIVANVMAITILLITHVKIYLHVINVCIIY